MEEAAILRLTSIGAAVIFAIIAATVACASVRSDNKRWWLPILGFGFATLILLLGYRVFRAGYTWGSFV